MRIVMMMSLEEFIELTKKTNWDNLSLGEVYVDKIENRWKAFKVTGIGKGYDRAGYDIEEFELAIQ